MINTDNEKKEFEHHTKNTIKNYVGYGVVAFLALAAAIVLFFIIFKREAIGHAFHLILGYIQPIVIGIIIAYLLNPLVNILEKKLRFLLIKMKCREEKAGKAAKLISVFLCICLFIALIIVLLLMIIPQLYTSIQSLIRQIPSQLRMANDWLEDVAGSNSLVSSISQDLADNAIKYVSDWLQNELLPKADTIISYLKNSVMGIFSTLLNCIIGIIAAVYSLLGKERFIGQFKKLFYGIFKIETANEILSDCRKVHGFFNGFIVGKVIDSTIIGLVTFICLTLLSMPYTLLVSVIVGVTNMIPFFGPYIGAIPSAFLILLADPKKGLIFIIFIIVLQQIDGNILGPRILGNSTGLPAFWVLFSILFFGGLMGFVGMLVGVPLCASILYFLDKYVVKRLKKKRLPYHSVEYRDVYRINQDASKHSGYEILRGTQDIQEDDEEDAEKKKLREKKRSMREEKKNLRQEKRSLKEEKKNLKDVAENDNEDKG